MVSSSPQRNRAITQASYLNICVAESRSLPCIFCIFPCWAQIWSCTFVTPWLHTKSSSSGFTIFCFLKWNTKICIIQRKPGSWWAKHTWTLPELPFDQCLFKESFWSHVTMITKKRKIIYNHLLTKRQWGTQYYWIKLLFFLYTVARNHIATPSPVSFKKSISLSYISHSSNS